MASFSGIYAELISYIVIHRVQKCTWQHCNEVQLPICIYIAVYPSFRDHVAGIYNKSHLWDARLLSTSLMNSAEVSTNESASLKLMTSEVVSQSREMEAREKKAFRVILK